MCDVDDSKDHYGFDRINISCAKGGKNNKKKSVVGIVIGVVLGVLFLIYVGLSVFAGYYAWTEFPSESIINKLLKSIVGSLFSPFYLFYIFLKISFFKAK